MRDTGLESVRRGLAAAVADLEQLDEADAEVEQLIAREARRRVHVRTGRLASTIGPGQAAGAVVTAGGTAADYAAPEEDRHPYLNPAAAAVLDQAVNVYATAVDRRLSTIRGV